MTEITLKATRLKSKTSAHKYLKEQLALPDYYGANLDALWDCLMEIDSPTTIRITGLDALGGEMGFVDDLVELFSDAQDENEMINFEASEDEK